MERRSFLRSACLGCAGAVLGGVALSACGSAMPLVKADVSGDALRVPLSGFGESASVLVRSPRVPYDILLHKRADGSYGAVYMLCTHRDQPLTATASGLYCPSHGSRFDTEGRVELGPATTPLRTFPVTADGDALMIHFNSNR